jgi:replicative DNA helicase
MVSLDNPAALAERHYVGALLHLRGAEARTAASWVRPEDLAEPQLRQVLASVQDGIRDSQHEVAAVVPRMIRTGRCPSDRAGLASVLVVELLGEVPHLLSWSAYAAVILDEAIRRHVRECATRLAQAADTDSLPSLLGVLADASLSVHELAKRVGVGSP